MPLLATIEGPTDFEINVDSPPEGEDMLIIDNLERETVVTIEAGYVLAVLDRMGQPHIICIY